MRGCTAYAFAQVEAASQGTHDTPLPAATHSTDRMPHLLAEAARRAEAALALAESWMRAHADGTDAGVRDVLAACRSARQRLAGSPSCCDDSAAATAALERELAAVEELLAHERAFARANAAQEALQHRLELHDLHENASKENAMLQVQRARARARSHAHVHTHWTQVRNELLLRQLEEMERERARLEADGAAQRALALAEEGVRFRRLSQRGLRAMRRCDRMELQVPIVVPRPQLCCVRARATASATCEGIGPGPRARRPAMAAVATLALARRACCGCAGVRLALSAEPTRARCAACALVGASANAGCRGRAGGRARRRHGAGAHRTARRNAKRVPDQAFVAPGFLAGPGRGSRAMPVPAPRWEAPSPTLRTRN